MQTHTFFGELIGDVAPLGTMVEQANSRSAAKLHAIECLRASLYARILRSSATHHIAHGLSGADVVAHDPRSNTTYIRLPPQLQRPIDGGCHCPVCKAHPERVPTWDTLAIPPNGLTWAVHMPNPQQFRDYLSNRRTG